MSENITEKAILDQFDGACGMIFVNLFSMGRENNGELALLDFNPKSNEHKLIMSMAVQVAATCDYHITMNKNWFQRWRIYRKYSKTIYPIKKSKATPAFTVQGLLDYMRPFVELSPEITFEQIYLKYYEK
jgi:hypothetical protein